MSGQLPAVPRWLNVVVGICLVVTAAAVVAAMVAPLADGFEQRHATVIAAALTGGATLGLGAFALRFQIKSQTNAAKLELYKQQLAVTQEMCQRCSVLNVELNLLANHSTGPDGKQYLDRYCDGVLEIVRGPYTPFIFVMPDEATGALQAYIDKLDATFTLMSNSVENMKELHEEHSKEITDRLETFISACRNALHLESLRRGMLTQLHRHSG